MLGRINKRQKEAAADVFNTVAKLFVSGGLVAPFLNQVDVGFLTGLMAVGLGIVFHLGASYVLGTTEDE